MKILITNKKINKVIPRKNRNELEFAPIFAAVVQSGQGDRRSRAQQAEPQEIIRCNVRSLRPCQLSRLLSLRGVS